MLEVYNQSGMWRLKAVWLFGILVMCMVIGNQNYATDGK